MPLELRGGDSDGGMTEQCYASSRTHNTCILLNLSDCFFIFNSPCLPVCSAKTQLIPLQDSESPRQADGVQGLGVRTIRRVGYAFFFREVLPPLANQCSLCHYTQQMHVNSVNAILQILYQDCLKYIMLIFQFEI